jgi:aromatic ring-cleaving dioxygenase
MTAIDTFHMHLYFDASTRASALAIREQLGAMTEFEVELQPVRDAPIGPHPTPMFNSHVEPEHFAAAVRWLMINHGPHPVLIHPNTGDDVADHTQHALWLGAPQPLNLEKL